jgi:FkbM family methyltransferase
VLKSTYHYSLLFEDREQAATCRDIEAMKANLISRVCNLIERTRWLSPYAGGIWPSLSFLLAASRDPEVLCRGKFGGSDVFFRGADIMALKEVMVDTEYECALPRLRHTESPVVLDIGAHIGLFSLWLLKRCPRARIHSVEADPQTYGVLLQNVNLRRAVGALWDARNAAAWGESSGELRFSSQGPSMSHKVSNQGDVVVEAVGLRRLLDEAVGRDGTVDLMKVDIEGSEETFLCADEGLLRRVGSIVIELHPQLCDAMRVEGLLRSIYPSVEDVKDRSSSKPLLLCY